MKKIELTGPQLMVVLAIKLGKKKIYLEWGRGSGKTTILGYILKELVKQMPRGCFTLVGETYKQILGTTLKSAKAGLEMFGVFEDVDYVVGRSGKKNGYAMPFERPDMWHNIIHFSNGSIIQLVSLDNKNSGRGLNSYAEVGDEAALLDKERLFVNVQISNRAGRNRFPKASLLNAEIYISSTPLTKKGKWFTDMEEEAKRNPKDYAFIKANAYSNAHNLPADYFDKMRKNSPTLLYYRAEILNLRPSVSSESFYAQLNSKVHYYKDYVSDENYNEIKFSTGNNKSINCTTDNDLTTQNPLILSIDFGVFNSMSIQQRTGNEHRILNSFWYNHPKILDDLIIDKFLPYYAPHKPKNNKILLYGGHDGNKRQVNAKKTLLQEVRDILISNGWKVKIMSKGAAPTHIEKYQVINSLLKENQEGVPVIRINENNNTDLIISLENAGVTEADTSALHKDKSSERSKIIKQQHATHLSDTVDIPIYDMYYQDVLRSSKQREYMGLLT